MIGLVAFAPKAKQHIMVGACGVAKLLTSWPSSNREKEKGIGSHNPLQGHTPH